MEDKILWACAETKEAITEEQANAADDLGWRRVPAISHESYARFLAKPVASKEEAVREIEHLDRFASTPDVSVGLVFETPDVEGLLNVPASIWTPTRQPEGQPEPKAPDGGSAKAGDAAKQPEKEDKPQPDSFPTIPEYIWKTLEQETQEDLAKKLVEYVIDRQKTAAYGSSFGDAALFAHLEDGERSDLAQKILEQKHGMTDQQARGERLVNDFQEQRVKLIEKAVDASGHINKHLEKWLTLSNEVVPFLKWSSGALALIVVALFAALFGNHVDGWEMALLLFVFALIAVSPATLLLIGRPLKGLDEWSPNKQEKKAEEAAKEEPAKDK